MHVFTRLCVRVVSPQETVEMKLAQVRLNKKKHSTPRVHTVEHLHELVSGRTGAGMR